MVARLSQHLKNYFIAGLLVVIPLATTIWLVVQLAIWSVGFLTSIPRQFNPIQGLNPWLIDLIDLGVGVLGPLLFILLTGFMARNIVGQWLLNLGEQILHAIPIAGSVYKTLKQLVATLFVDSSTKFRRVVLIQYPRRGMWTLAFVTDMFQANLGVEGSQRMMSVFIPTTPNPTTGWYCLVTESETVEVFMPVEDAFRLIISGGIITPESFVASLQKRPYVAGVPNLQNLVEEERQNASGTASEEPEVAMPFQVNPLPQPLGEQPL
ncbi:MAG: DUF502 domain-containing protein [Synechococcales cyanobacterium]